MEVGFRTNAPTLIKPKRGQGNGVRWRQQRASKGEEGVSEREGSERERDGCRVRGGGWLRRRGRGFNFFRVRAFWERKKIILKMIKIFK